MFALLTPCNLKMYRKYVLSLNYYYLNSMHQIHETFCIYRLSYATKKTSVDMLIDAFYTFKILKV